MSETLSLLEKRFLMRHVGETYQVTPISQAIVHQVYRITAPSKTYYLKIRGEHFAQIPDIASRPEDIAFEIQALQLMRFIAPDAFPAIIASDIEHGLLLLSEVMLPEENLDALLRQGKSAQIDWRSLGASLASLHEQLSTQQLRLHGEDEDVFYGNKLLHYLLVSEEESLNQVVAELKKMPRQNILADLSPKNIGITSHGITFCDLESLHFGNAIFDVGFLTGHVLLHHLNGDDSSLDRALDLLVHGYYGKKPYPEDLFVRIVLGICLCRLEQRIMPYDLSFLPAKTIKKAITDIETLLQKPNLTCKNLVQLVQK